MRAVPARILIVASLLLVVLLAACASADEPTEAETAVATSVPQPAADDAEVDTGADSDAPDERTAEQVAIDELDVTMYQMGIRDLAGVSDCVLERLESEGLSIVGQEAAELAALVGCEPDVSRTLFGEQNPAFGSDAWQCITNDLAAWIGELPLADANSFFEAPALPPELITTISEQCAVPEADLITVFG